MTRIQHPSRRGSTVVVALALAGATVLAGCGSSSSGAKSNGEESKTGPQVAKDAAAALAKTDAVHFSGTQKSSEGEAAIDFQFQSDGSQGTLQMGSEKVEIITVDSTVYIKAGKSFWETSAKLPAAQAGQLDNKWLKASTTQATSFATFNLKGFSDALSNPSDGVTIEDKVTTGTLDGQDVVVATESDGSKLYVAATGEPLPLKIVGNKSGQSSGDGSFTDYGKRKDIKAPADAIDGNLIG